MLEPQSRMLFTEALRPPEGYQLEWAVGTTYTMDLVASLAAPLAFALFDWEQDDQGGGSDPIPLLEALRRYADRMTIFVQAGRISVPKPQQFLLSYLDGSIVEATAPTPGGLFHPKVWLLRFASEGEPVRYRFVCMSRNLTFDRCWDTAVILEGPVIEKRRNAILANRPLSEFVAALPGLALRRVVPEARRRIKAMAEEVLRVEWDLPPGFRDLRFWPLGVEGHRRWPFSGRVDRLLVVSPFLSGDTLDRVGESERGDVLVSRLEALQEVEGHVLERFGDVYVLDDGADIDAQAADDESDSPDSLLQGLHAKLYVADAGWKASVWTGSANATAAGLGPNVEFLVELVGTKPKCGVGKLLEPGKGEARFVDLLRPYTDHVYKPPDEVAEGLRSRLEEARAALAKAKLVIKVGDEKEGRFAIRLTRNSALKLPSDTKVMCWPAMLAEGAASPLSDAKDAVAEFELAGEELTSLFAFSAEATLEGRTKRESFALNLEMEGAPDDVKERILRHVLQDRGRVLRLLLFLLADGDAQQAAALLAAGGHGGAGDGASTLFELPLFESLLRALDREPAKLDRVADVITGLRKTPEGESLIPEAFDEIWGPIWEAREAMR